MTRPRSLNDPLRTRRLRARYTAGMNSRFGRTRSLVRTTIDRNNALAIRNEDVGPRAGEPGHQGDFGGSKEHQVALFLAWLRLQTRKVVLGKAPGPAGVETNWQEPLIRQTYSLAVSQAAAAAERAGLEGATDSTEAFLTNPATQEQIRIVLNRNFQILENITADMEDQLGKELAVGLDRGLSREQIAQSMVKHIDGISLTRARTLAQTEVTHAHAEATLDTFERFGFREVVGRVEFTLNMFGTAEPCVQCKSLEGTKFRISEARGVIPVHPKCQCGWMPVSVRMAPIVFTTRVPAIA